MSVNDEEERLRSAALQNAQSILSARRHAEERLRKQSEWLRVTLTSIGDAVISTDAEGRITFMNGVAESLTGWSSAEAMGRLLPDVFHIVNEQTRAPVDNPALRALTDGTIVGLANHTVLIAKDGREWPIDDSAAPIRDDNGSVTGAVLVFREIAEFKRHEAAVAERNRLVALRADISTALASSLSVAMVLQQCCEGLVRNLQVAFARIWTLNPASSVLELQASAGTYTHLDGAHNRIPVGQFKIGRIAASRKPHLTNSTYDDPNISDPEWARREGMRAFAGFPLLVEDRVMGVVAMFSRESISDGVLTELAPLVDGIGQYIDRKESEARVHRSEEQLRLAVKAAKLGQWNVDLRSMEMTCTDSCKANYGRRPEESFSYDDLWQALHPEDRQRVQQAVQSAIDTREEFDTEYRAVWPDGGIHWIMARGRASFAADGTPLDLTGVTLDLTERKQAEEALSESERQFRMLADSIPQLAWMARADGNIFWYNQRWYDYTGTTLEQMIGWGWQSVHDPRELPRVLEQWKICLETGRPFDMIFPLKGKDGVFRSFLTRIMPLMTDDGRVDRWFGTNTDISEAKRAEEEVREARSRLDSTLVAGEIGTWEFDVVSNTVRADTNLARMFGVSADEAVGGPLEAYTKAIHPDDQDRVAAAIRKTLETGERLEVEYRIVGPDASIRWVIARGRVEHDASGRALRLPGVVVDINSQRKAEEALRASEERTRIALDSAELGAWNIDTATNTMSSDARFQTIFGVPGRQITYEQAFAILHPDDRQRVREAIALAIRPDDPVPYAIEYRVVHPDGAIRWVFAKGRANFGPAESGKQLTTFDGTVADITEKKRAEQREALLLAEAATANAKFQALFDQGALFAGVMTLDGVLIEANRRCLDACGYTRDQVIGRPFWECPWWSQSTALMDRIKEATACAAAGETYQAELPYFVADGGERVVDFLLVPITDTQGRVVFLAPTGNDITERRRAEDDRQKFVTLAENITDFIGMYDLDGVPFYVNEAGMQMVGLDGIEHVRRTTVRDHFFPEDQPKILDEFLPCVVERGNGETEVRFRHFKTGKAIWMLFKVVTLLDAHGEHVGFGTVSRDMTQRRELEDNLRQMASDLSEGSRRKDEFLATLAHELRNPLAPIRNGLQMMKLSGGSQTIMDDARAIMERQLAQMVRLVDDLLDISRISRGKLDLRQERVDLAAIIRQAVETSHPAIEASRQSLNVSLPSQPVLLNGDSVRLVQVFSNLLNNSCKYSDPDGQISVNAQRQGNEVVVTVKDTGIGIPADMLPRIFEMFTQIDRSLDKAEGGLGIGLTLVQRILELHGGSISASSEGVGKGSEFAVRLPMLEDTIVAPAALSGEPKGNTAQRILVVDDNRDSASSLAMLLQLSGSQTQTAFDGLAAFEVASQFQPHVVLLDIGLPRLNGYEVAQKIRGAPWGKSMILVALTGWGQDDDRKKSREAGFDSHLVKPVDYSTLRKLLAELLPAINS